MRFFLQLLPVSRDRRLVTRFASHGIRFCWKNYSKFCHVYGRLNNSLFEIIFYRGQLFSVTPKKSWCADTLMIGVRLMFTAWLEICSFISKLSDKKVVLSCVQCFLRPRLSWVVWRSWNYETSRLLFSMYRHVHGRYVWSMFKVSFQCSPLRGLLYVCPVFSTTVVWLRDLVIMKFESFGVTVNLHTSLIDALTHARCVNNA